MTSGVKFDLHTHHERCGHATGSVEDMIVSAIAHGLDVIGISDHSPFFHHPQDRPEPRNRMAKSHFPGYVDEVLALKDKYRGKIDVLLGVESDFYQDDMTAYLQAYQDVPFDYLIGSVHFVHGQSIFDKTRWQDADDNQLLIVKEAYYQAIVDSAKSGLFQVLGHIDALKAYCPRISSIHTPMLDDVLQVIAAQGVAIEVNTSGKKKDCGGWYPSDDILKLAHKYGVLITFGSDAHHPMRVGDEFEMVSSRLRDIGFTSWVYFKNREKVEVEL